jgi:hypothetical protein
VYGAEMIPSRSISSEYFSGVHLNEHENPLAGLRLAVANILSPIQKQRSFPHLISSKACGSDRQNSLSCSTFIDIIYPQYDFGFGAKISKYFLDGGKSGCSEVVSSQ